MMGSVHRGYPQRGGGGWEAGLWVVGLGGEGGVLPMAGALGAGGGVSSITTLGSQCWPPSPSGSRETSL